MKTRFYWHRNLLSLLIVIMSTFSVFTWQELQSVRGQLASEQSRCFKLEVHAQSLECLCPFSSQSFNLLLYYFVIRSCFCQRKTVSKVTRELSLFVQLYIEL